jgi:hypothetical protein
MDNIIYTCAAPLIIGIFFSAIRHFHTLHVSNTKLIIRQSDQIQFILSRVIELNKKIRKIEQELDDLNCNMNDSVNSSVLDTIQEEEVEVDLKEDLTEDLKEDNDKDKDKDKEISFEIVESTPIKTQKENGWIRYLF